AERRRHARDSLFPTRSLVAQLLSAGGRQRIELRASIVVRRPPLRLQEATVLQTVQRRVERALLHGKMPVRDLADAQENSVAVLRAERDGFENQEVEGAGEEFDRGHGGCSLLGGQGERVGWLS